jgi:DNA-binding NtrC family response regulator
MPLAAQAKLLRAVETKEVLPDGGDRPVKIDARIVVATHRDLPAMAEADKFRPDLLYRLSVVTLRVPPLRERLADLASIAEALLQKHAREQRKHVVAIDPAVLALFARQTWPGNVRELSNAIERAVLFCEGDTLLPRDLPIELHAIETDGGGDGDALGPHERSAAETTTATLTPDACQLAPAILAFERDHIARVLRQTQGNRDAAAKLLGLSPATLYRHLQRVGLKGYHVNGGVQGDESADRGTGRSPP